MLWKSIDDEVAAGNWSGHGIVVEILTRFSKSKVHSQTTTTPGVRSSAPQRPELPSYVRRFGLVFNGGRPGNSKAIPETSERVATERRRRVRSGGWSRPGHSKVDIDLVSTFIYILYNKYVEVNEGTNRERWKEWVTLGLIFPRYRWQWRWAQRGVCWWLN